MRKNIFGRQFKRDTNERKALFKSLLSSLVLNESIKTTEEKAKAIKSLVDKVVTRAKKDGEASYRLIAIHLTNDAAKKLIRDIAPRFQGRPGGYTRILRLGRRVSDNAQMVVMEWVEKAKAADAALEKEEKTKVKKQPKKKTQTKSTKTTKKTVAKKTEKTKRVRKEK